MIERKVVEFPHGTASYDIILYIFREMRLPPGVRVLDLTYGVGRFYRRVVTEFKPYLIGVDIIKHSWEVPPAEFYLADARFFNPPVSVDIVVVDPPWSSLKRGFMPRQTGISHLPYHMPARPEQIIRAARSIAHRLRVPLLAKYYKPVEPASILIVHNITMMKREGRIYYSVVYPRA